MLNVGERAGFVISASEDEVKLVGYGVYEGEFIPPAEVSSAMNKLCVCSPRIKLDNGQEVYGFEGYWGSEEGMKSFVAKRKSVVMVDIDQYRKENQQ